MTAWAEEEGLLTERQGGFRRGRRLEDQLFTLTQCIEAARKEQRTLICCFLDVAKAYDSVPHAQLICRLQHLGIRPEWVTLIHRLYSENTVRTKLDGLTVEWVLPGLTYADDVVLTAESVCDMQKLLDICTEVATGLGLKFNTNKSAAVLFAGPQDRTFGSLRLGVDSQPSEEPAFCADGISGLWKAVVVPGMTFANAVVCVPGDVRAHIERRQREIGRQALSCHGTVANEAVQGDLGWSSFEAREATSKIAYDGRLRHMDTCRWAKRLFRYTQLTGLQTRWQKRLYQLQSKYDFFADPVQASSAREWEREVRKKVPRRPPDVRLKPRLEHQETQQWLKDAQLKTTLEVYVENKRTIGSEARLYDNSLGSRVRTRSYRRHFDSTVTTSVRRVCGAHDETVAHIVLECAGLRPSRLPKYWASLLLEMDTKPLRLGQPHQRTGLPRTILQPPAPARSKGNSRIIIIIIITSGCHGTSCVLRFIEFALQGLSACPCSSFVLLQGHALSCKVFRLNVSNNTIKLLTLNKIVFWQDYVARFKRTQFVACDDLSRMKHQFPTRLSRRIQGLHPEHGLLPPRTKQPTRPTMDNEQSQIPAASIIIYLPAAPRTAATFYGKPYKDVEDWIDQYKRVPHHNGWTDEQRLNNWDIFKSELMGTLINHKRRERAEDLLRTRTQAVSSTSTTTWYSQATSTST
ncbi:hypothetical protein HPB47_010498 [Ixodes persulcatus]|uniref:Uncharacterized protein n=1 Tax=Ixodes persulcatus TaxID=34615 RepID=A0AC60NYW3_IXOPE|nr:hypothetical protein HPB47_010498 [Ixodes persulcatus]